MRDKTEDSTMHSPNPKQFQAFGKTFSLSRFPYPDLPDLQAWDSADSYLLAHMEEQHVDNNRKFLILNDDFGALTLPLLASGFTCDMVTPSKVAMDAVAANIHRNDLSSDRLRLIPLTDFTPTEYQVILIKIPKELELLRTLLQKVRPCLNAQSIIAAGAKTRLIHNTTTQLFAQMIGPSPTSLAWKKARLILPQWDSNLQPDLDYQSKSYPFTNFDLTIIGGSGVFGSERLDRGTQCLLDYLPQGERHQVFVDLACGSGVIGAMLAHLNPDSSVIACDESFLATAAAARTAQVNHFQNMTIQTMNGLEALAPGSVDRIFLNPPFHHGLVEGTFMADFLFAESARTLQSGGELWVVANRHLPYPPILKQHFARCEQIKQTSQFKVFRCIKS